MPGSSNTTLRLKRGAAAPAGQNGVLVYTSDYLPNDGGISRLCQEIVHGLRLSGSPAQVLHCPASSHWKATGRRTPVPQVVSPHQWDAFRLLSRRGRGGPVICGLWYPDGLIAVLARVRPLVILAHGAELLPPEALWRRPLWRSLLRTVCASADLVVANSAFTERLVREAAPSAHVAAIPLGVDHVRFCPGDRRCAKRAFAVEGRLVISTVARLHSYKGHDVVMRALADLPAEVRSRFLYLVAGRGPSRDWLEGEARRLGVHREVRFLGFVPEEGLADLYRASDLFALCTREVGERREVEGFGLAFLEAQACGTPVVGTRTGGIADAVREGEGGWLIDPDDADSLARILMRMTTDTASFCEAGESARRRVERDCTWAQYVGRLLEALRSHGIAVN